MSNQPKKSPSMGLAIAESVPKNIVILLFSGGSDSVLLAWSLLMQGHRVHAIHYTYSHPAKGAEIVACVHIDRILRVYFPELWQMQVVGLTDAIDARSMWIGEGEEGSRVVHNRNAIFLNVAIPIAISRGSQQIIFGAVLDDNNDYPDCRPAFVETMDRYATEYFGISIGAPLLSHRKSELDIKAVPEEIRSLISSCYQPKRMDTGYEACGTCNSCLSNSFT